MSYTLLLGLTKRGMTHGQHPSNTPIMNDPKGE
jgi:hypothetical protein